MSAGVTAISVYSAAGDLINNGANHYLHDAEERICTVCSSPVSGIAPTTWYVYDAAGDRVARGSITTWSYDPSTDGFSTTSDYIVGPSGEQLT